MNIIIINLNKIECFWKIEFLLLQYGAKINKHIPERKPEPSNSYQRYLEIHNNICCLHYVALIPWFQNFRYGELVHPPRSTSSILKYHGWWKEGKMSGLGKVWYTSNQHYEGISRWMLVVNCECNHKLLQGIFWMAWGRAMEFFILGRLPKVPFMLGRGARM